MNSVADAVREEQRLLLREFVIFYDEVDASHGDNYVVERFLDGHGEEFRKNLSRVEAELRPALQILGRNRGKDIPSAAVEGITTRIETALSLLMGWE